MIRRNSLGRQRTEGNENVRRIVYSFFESLCKVIDEEGGDVLRLAGDAIIVSMSASSRHFYRVYKNTKLQWSRSCSERGSLKLRSLWAI